MRRASSLLLFLPMHITGMRAVALLMGIAVATGLAPELLVAQTGVEASAWWEEMKEMDQDLLAGKWKKVAKEAPKLARNMTEHSWYHPDLTKLFAEVSLYEAIAAANLNKDAHAIWLWHIAQNLFRDIRDRDLVPYGRAAKLLYEHPLRARGEVPFRWRGMPQGPLRGTSFAPPRHDDSGDKPVVLSSTAVQIDRRSVLRPVHVEVIYDREGRPHQPVVTFPPDVHPAVTWAVVRFIPTRKTEPAHLDGKTIPFMMTIEYHFEVIRGSSRGPDFSRTD